MEGVYVRLGEKTKTIYTIRDPGGVLVAEHHREEKSGGGKECFWKLPGTNPDDFGLKGMPLADLPLYGAERIAEWDEDDLIVLVEGEKPADALLGVGINALGTVTGAGSAPGPEALEVLRGRAVCVWGDGDEPGEKHASRLADALQGVACEVSMFAWYSAPEDVKGPDAADHPAVVSGDPEALDRLLNDLLCAPRWVSPSPSSKGQGQQGHPLRATRFAEMGEPKERRFVVEGLVPEAYPVVVFGSGGVAKSALMLSACTAIAANAGKWLGLDTVGGPVLYLDFELDADEQNRRAHLLAQGAGLQKPPDDLFYISALGCSPHEAFRAALEACEEYGVRMVVLDSWGPALEGDALAARDIIGFFRRQLEPFRAAGIAVIIVDHQAKLQAGEGYQGKSAFGSVYKTNLARSVMQVELAERGEGTITVKLRQVKSNFGPLAEPFGAKITFGETAWTVEATDLDAASLAGEGSLNAGDRVKLALEDGPAFPWEVAESTGLAHKTVKNELSKLRKAGKVESTSIREGQAEQVSLVSLPHRDRDRDSGPDKDGSKESLWSKAEEDALYDELPF